jgi:hypothetical protein
MLKTAMMWAGFCIEVLILGWLLLLLWSVVVAAIERRIERRKDAAVADRIIYGMRGLNASKRARLDAEPTEDAEKSAKEKERTNL